LPYLRLDREGHGGEGDALDEAAGRGPDQLAAPAAVEAGLLDAGHHVHDRIHQRGGEVRGLLRKGQESLGQPENGAVPPELRD